MSLPAILDCFIPYVIHKNNFIIPPNSRHNHLANSSPVLFLLRYASVTLPSAPVTTFGHLDADVFHWLSRLTKKLFENEISRPIASSANISYFLLARCLIVGKLLRSWAGQGRRNGNPVRVPIQQKERQDDVPPRHELLIQRWLLAFLRNKHITCHYLLCSHTVKASIRNLQAQNLLDRLSEMRLSHLEIQNVLTWLRLFQQKLALIIFMSDSHQGLTQLVKGKKLSANVSL